MIKTASIVTIGDEILIGQIIDTNSAWLSQKLNSAGIDVVQIISISDKKQVIKEILDQQMSQVDLVIMTGGLGPTKDDVTKMALAEYFEKEMVFDQVLFDMIKSYFDKRGIPVMESHKQQCYMPSGIDILRNNMGTAPGMLFKKDNSYVLSMPGVPHEMKWIFNNPFLDKLDEINESKKQLIHHTIRTAGKGETWIADQITDILDDLPDNISIAYLPSIGQVRLRLSSRDLNVTAETLQHFSKRITERLGKIVFAYGTETLEEHLQKQFIEKGLTLSLAESCTGGALSKKLVSISGSSQYFEGSLVTYSYNLKEAILGVNNKTLTSYGAVSEETVKEMLVGLLNKTNTDVGIAISGIAGPSGGTPLKPVGTIWMAWGDKSIQKTKKLTLAKDRKLNIEYTVVAAMNALRRFLLER